MTTGREGFSRVRWSILTFLKHGGTASIADIAKLLGVTYEAGRLQLLALEKEGWVAKHTERPARAGVGRPLGRYRLSAAGEHLFPKHYDELAVQLIDTVAAKLGDAALTQVLASLTDARVRQWQPLLEGFTLEQRLDALKAVYLENDPFMSVEMRDGELRLIERNCPFLNVAQRRPGLCSVTVSTLARVLGMRVVREERFQSGDERCVFRVLRDEAIDPGRPGFEPEPQLPNR